MGKNPRILSVASVAGCPIHDGIIVMGGVHIAINHGWAIATGRPLQPPYSPGRSAKLPLRT